MLKMLQNSPTSIFNSKIFQGVIPQTSAKRAGEGRMGGMRTRTGGWGDIVMAVDFPGSVNGCVVIRTDQCFV